MAIKTSENSSSLPPAPPRPSRKDNTLLSLAINILIPSLLMMKGHKWFGWSSQVGLSVALAFPLGYGLYDFGIRKRYNFISMLGFVSILLTGGIGLLHLPKEWIAAKEATVPTLIGLCVLASLKTPYPLVKTFLYNPDLIDVALIEERLAVSGKQKAFEGILKRATYLLASSFLLSGMLNYMLAKVMIQSETGTIAFTEELGRMNMWTYPVIVLPCSVIMVVALFYLFRGIREMTGLEIEQVMLSAKERSLDKPSA